MCPSMVVVGRVCCEGGLNEVEVYCCHVTRFPVRPHVSRKKTSQMLFEDTKTAGALPTRDSDDVLTPLNTTWSLLPVMIN